MKTSGLFLSAILCLCLSSQAIAQQQKPLIFKGKVVNEKGEPLYRTSIHILGTADGTTSDIDGNFSISAKDKMILKFSYIGRKNQELQLDRRKTTGIIAQMDPEAEVLSSAWIGRNLTVAEEEEGDYRLGNSAMFEIVENSASFPGGKDSLQSFIRQALTYPDEAFQKGEQGQVLIRFTVEKTGEITNIHTHRSVSPMLNQEAIRVIQSMPRWVPAEQFGKPVATQLILPVNFNIWISVDYK